MALRIQCLSQCLSQCGFGPSEPPATDEPLAPGPNAAYAATKPASEAPAKSTVLLTAVCRASRDQTNSLGTITVSPFHPRMAPRRVSTELTEIASPRSEALRKRPRTVCTLGPR